MNVLIIPELGQLALIMAFCLALAQAGLPWFAVNSNPAFALRQAKNLTLGQCLMLGISFACLAFSFAINDFSVLYVANNSSRELPLWYRLCAVWGAHEGSMLLWVLILSLWTSAVALLSRALPDDYLARVIAILGMVSSALLLFILATSNPFVRLLPQIPINGRDLNALLQDPGFLFHPPTLYMGYVGFSVAFAFAIAALICGEYRRSFAKWARPWTLAAWCFLTLGITMGSWWAYRVLGWGGWWFWDPVENASFMPWLAGTALLHSLIVTEKRGAFKAWTMLLAIITFSLSLLGTFLVRSGILTSVHAFAADPTRGVYMLIILLVTVGGSLTLYAARAAAIKNQIKANVLSREMFLLFNNVILVAAMSTVLLGTLYPLIIDILGLGKLSVGAPYFNSVFIPLMAPLLFFMGLGPHCAWGQMALKPLIQRLRLLFAISVSVGIVLPWLVSGLWSGYVALGVMLIIWVLVTTIASLMNKQQQFSWRHITRSQWAMLLAHLGVAITAVGIVLSSAYSSERQLRMSPGDIATLGPYQFRFIDMTTQQHSNYERSTADFVISRHKKIIGHLHPEKRYYTIQKTMMSNADINVRPLRDLYIALGERLDGQAQQWAVRIYYKPFIRWIWLGGFMMLFGGLLAVTNRRYWSRQQDKNTSQFKSEIPYVS